MSLRTHGFKSPVGDMRQTPPRRNSRPLHPQAAAARRRRRLQWKAAGRPAMLRGRRSRPGRADAMGTKQDCRRSRMELAWGLEDAVGHRLALAVHPSTTPYTTPPSHRRLRPQHPWLLSPVRLRWNLVYIDIYTEMLCKFGLYRCFSAQANKRLQLPPLCHRG
jgi:hypothetical protein